MTFARQLRRLRVARGLSQRQVAGPGLSASYISRLEAGSRHPTARTVVLLAERLGCSPAELTELTALVDISPRGQGTAGASGPVPAAVNVQLGQLALAAGAAQRAAALFTTALAQAGLDPMLRGEAALGVARALERQGRIAEAGLAYEKLVLAAMSDPGELASPRLVLGLCRCLYLQGELRRVVELAREALGHLRSLQATRSDIAAELTSTLAATYFELGDTGAAERLLREAVEQAGSRRARAGVLWNASRLASDLGRHREALDYAEEALVYFRHGDDRRQAARLLGSYGYVLLRSDPPRVDEAVAVLRESLAGLREADERSFVLSELSRAARYGGDCGGADGARAEAGNAGAAIDLALAAVAAAGSRPGLGRVIAETALGSALAAAGRTAEAAAAFAAASSALAALPASRPVARAWVELAEAMADSGDATAAVAAFRRATDGLSVGAVPPATWTKLLSDGL